MGGNGRAPSEGAALEGLIATSNRLRPGHVIEIQRSRLLAAMVEVCKEYGVANVTVAHVVERAGVSRRTFYEIFEDREACFLAAFDDALARASRYMLDACDPKAQWDVRIRTALTALLRFLDSERGMGQLLIVGSLGAGHEALERRKCGIAQIINLIDEGRKQSRTGDELPPLTAEGIVGGVLSVLHSRLLEDDSSRLVELSGPLMSMIVLPYLGSAAARRELGRSTPAPAEQLAPMPADPLRDVQMRLTYRTIRVLAAVAARPGSSNREIGLVSGMSDQGQISKLLTRLSRLELIENSGVGLTRGAPNAWILTGKGQQIERAISAQGERSVPL